MTPLSERMVEAAARASVAFAYNPILATDITAFNLWCAANQDLWQQELACARAALTAAHTVAEAEGAGVFVVPEEVACTDKADDKEWAWVQGANHMRDTWLAGRVTL